MLTNTAGRQPAYGLESSPTGLLGALTMNAEDWLSAYAERLGTRPPAPAHLDALLALAGEAAHASERSAAPVACWMAAMAGVAPDDALALARELQEPASERGEGDQRDPGDEGAA